MEVSEPIEPSGSAPLRAMGATMTRSQLLGRVAEEALLGDDATLCWGVSIVRAGSSSRRIWSWASHSP